MAAPGVSEMASAIESVLLVAAGPISRRALARVLETDTNSVEAAIDCLVTELQGRGIRLQVHEGQLQLVTAPENADIVRTFLRLPQQQRMSRASLETLAIIAYGQPTTRSEIEEVRGVGVDRVVASLVARGLIEEIGRRNAPGRPIEYGTTNDFLQLFGLTALDELALARHQTQTTAKQISFGVLGPDGPQADSTANTAKD